MGKNLRENIELREGKGYKAQDVDDCIDFLCAEYKKLETTKAKNEEALKLRIVEIEKERDAVKAKETEQLAQFAEVMSAAKRTADLITKEAQEKAEETNKKAADMLADVERKAKEAENAVERILKDAETRANTMIQKSMEDLSDIHQSFLQVKSEADTFKASVSRVFKRVESLTDSHIASIDNMRKNLSGQSEEETVKNESADEDVLHNEAADD